MNYKFSKYDARKFSWDGVQGFAYNSKEDFGPLSLALLELTGRHGKIRNITVDRAYLVLSGKGTFEINGETITVGPEDVVFVPKNSEYDYWTDGSLFKLALVDSPAYEPGDDENL